jgi:HK97 gp10 family phage protein
MAIEFRLTDDSIRVLNKLKQWPGHINAEMTKEMESIGQDVRTKIMENMQDTQRASWSYQRGKKWHFPSAPGNPPAIDGGRLVGSFEIFASKDAVEVGTNVVYAKFLEKGTGKMKPRPFLKSGMNGIKFEQRIQDAMKRGIK